MSWTYTAFSDGTKASAESVMGNFYNARHGNLLPRDPSTGAASTATATSLSGWNRIYVNNIYSTDTSYSTNGAICMAWEYTASAGWTEKNTSTVFYGGTVSSFFYNDHSAGATPVKRFILVLSGTANTINSFAFSDFNQGINGGNIIAVGVKNGYHLLQDMSLKWNTTTIFYRGATYGQVSVVIFSK